MIKIFKSLSITNLSRVNCGCGCGSIKPFAYSQGMYAGARDYFNKKK